LTHADPLSTVTAPPRRPWWPRLLLAALLAVAVAAFYLLGLQSYVSWDYLRANLDNLDRAVEEHYLLALLLFFFVYTAITALSLPTAGVLSLVAGALFGRWVGTGVVSAASTCGATLAFLSSRYLLQDFVQRRFGQRLRILNDGIARDGAFYLLILRLVPAIPFVLVNLGMGLTTIRLRTYVWVSWLGMLPGTFLYLNAGTALRTIDSPSGLLSPTVIASLALLGVVPLLLRLGLRWLGRRGI
jgi:uncharacterized membrane protein YdjX (TVP38/TMEM64 family)